MNPTLGELLERIRELEAQIDGELRRRRAELQADFEHRRVRFEAAVLERQRRFRIGALRYILDAELRHLAAAPVSYLVFFPIALLDLAVTLYQHVCFPLFGIGRVRRGDFFAFDRMHLGYLNVIEKVNCAYCSYANGVAGYVREVVGRTEQYWCPIKHSRHIVQAHAYYHGFVDFGDAQAYRDELARLRTALAAMARDRPPPAAD